MAVLQKGHIDAGGCISNGFATTLDGGRTWIHGDLPGLTKVTGGSSDRVSDPVVAFGPDGTVYANALLLGGSPGDLAVNVSVDKGVTWSAPRFFVDPRVPSSDKNWMIVDTGSGAGHHPGRIYVVWDYVAPVVYAYSDDKAQTWTFGQTGFPIYPGPGIGVQPLVLPNGDLAVIWTTTAYAPNATQVSPDVPSIANPKLVVAIAKGAGSIPTGAPLVFSPPVPIATYRGRGVGGQRAGDSLPSAAVDARTGAMYVIWNDARFRTDLVNDIVLARSEDGGLTWSPPLRINPTGEPYVDHFTPAVGVDDDGTVEVMYRRRQETDGSPETYSRHVDTLFQESFDGGRTFTAPLSVNSVDNDMAFAAQSRGGAFLGDYNQIAPAGDLTYIVRTEPIRVDAGEPRRFPPAFHHQRTYVAVVGAPETQTEPRARVKGRRTLPATGAQDGAAGLVLVAAAFLLGAGIAGRRGRT